MGCRKKISRLVWKSDFKKILFTWFVSLLWLSVLTPVVVADETSISVTFDPDGVIDIDVSPKSYGFGTVQIGTWENTTGSTFTLYNNGTIPMDTQIKTNATTDSTQLTLDADGTPGVNQYSFRTDGLDSDGYITTAYAGDVDSALSASGSKGFDLCLNIGSSLSSNFSPPSIHCPCHRSP